MLMTKSASPLARFAIYFSAPTPSRRTRQYLGWYFRLRTKKGTPSPGSLLRLLCEAGLGQADVVLALLRLNSLESLRLAEVMVGRRIRRCPPCLRVLPPPKQDRGDSTRPKDERRILTVVENPRLPGSPAHARFTLLRPGRTVEQCLARGMTRRDFRMALDYGWVQLEGGEPCRAA